MAEHVTPKDLRELPTMKATVEGTKHGHDYCEEYTPEGLAQCNRMAMHHFDEFVAALQESHRHAFELAEVVPKYKNWNPLEGVEDYDGINVVTSPEQRELYKMAVGIAKTIYCVANPTDDDAKTIYYDFFEED